MKKHTKLLALLLALCLTVGLLAGCSSPAADNSANTTPDNSTVTDNNGGTGNSTGGTSSGDDLSEKITYKLTTHSNAAQGDWNEYRLIQIIEEKFNVDIQVEQISNEVWADQLSLMFTSEELPDFFLNSLGDSDIATYGSQGYLIPMEDYINETDTPNLYKMFEEVPAIRKACTELDGHIYAIQGAQMTTRELSQNRFYVRTDWANEAIGKQPETLDEFYEFLKYVKEHDMDGDGDTTNEIPLGGYYTQCPTTINIMLPIMCAFGYTQQYIQAIDDKVVYVPAEDNYKEFLRYMKKLLDEDLLDKEYFTQDVDQFCAKDAQHLYGAYCYYASFVNAPDEEWYKAYDSIPPMTSEYNSVQMWPCNDVGVVGKFIITKNAPHPERLMKILDWCLSEEGYLAINMGYERGSWEEYKDYGYELTWDDDEHTGFSSVYMGPNGQDDPPEGYETPVTFARAKYSPDYGYFPIYVHYNNKATGGEAWLTHNIVDNLAPYYHVGWSNTIKTTQAENDELALLNVDIQAYKEEMETKMMTGELDIDASWDTYIDGLKARGLDDLIAIYQGAYDRWKAL